MKSGLDFSVCPEPACFASAPSGQASPIGDPLIVVRSFGQIGMSKVCRRFQNVRMSNVVSPFADFKR